MKFTTAYLCLIEHEIIWENNTQNQGKTLADSTKAGIEEFNCNFHKYQLMKIY